MTPNSDARHTLWHTLAGNTGCADSQQGHIFSMILVVCLVGADGIEPPTYSV